MILFIYSLSTGFDKEPFNNCIKFDLDIKEKNIVLKDYFYKMVQMKKHKIYEAELIQPACPYWLGSRNKNN
ncbi:hypothetical protein DM476_10010 [Lactobacillus helveticus]|uniref:hypothetical protein n=1 Tax=Lactobacillus helveticus TaxID=1587 RepID=UPI00030203FA|nr:hypothetical protein [Lactobacillus helveticus]AUI76421.1 hypothetical protein Lh22155_06690 [Lactobacillus helveticus]PXZ14624.1 hypothetical protein DM476_10010 [Lactobacillus helveticus]